MQVFASRVILLALSACASSTVPGNGGQSAEVASTQVRKFVQHKYIHGVPFEEASRFGPEVTPELVAMLEDREFLPYWDNVAVTLGVAGSEGATRPLLEFIASDGPRKLTPEEFDAKTAAVTALGFLANRNADKLALGYLIDGLDPNEWNERGLAWSSPFHENDDERNLQLTRLAINALALSGQPSAGKALQALKEKHGVPYAFNQGVLSQVDEALEAHEEIRKEGLAAYYKTKFR